MVKRYFIPGLLLLGALAVISCDNYFSSSWGTGAARDYDSSKIDVNAGNVDSWVEQARGNRELAEAVTKKIIEKLKENLSEKERAKLQGAGVTLAIESSGIGVNILKNGSDAATSIANDGADAVVKLLENVQGDFKASNGSQAASNLSEIVSGSMKTDGDGAPILTGEYAKNADPTDVSEAVLVLTLAVLEQENINVKTDPEKLDVTQMGVGLTVDPIDGKVKVDPSYGGTPSKEALTLAAYLNLINSDPKYADNQITGGITSAIKK